MNLEYLRMAQYVCDVSCRVGLMCCEHDVLQWHWHGRASTTMAVLWQCDGNARATPWQFHGSTMAGPWQWHGKAILQSLGNTVRITIEDWSLLGLGVRMGLGHKKLHTTLQSYTNGAGWTWADSWHIWPWCSRLALHGNEIMPRRCNANWNESVINTSQVGVTHGTDRD